MSDMPRPGSPPTAAAHAQHDPLLVAQLTAGDPLDEDRRREAEELVKDCSACARLATDLRTVSGAVAWEPVPPRRRDFRIDAEQAERLRGNALTRFLRGLSLPRSRALRPAAAGLLSVGLVFIVAGSVWPGDDGLTVEGETNAVPVHVEAPAPTMEVPFDEILRSQAGSPVERLEVDLEALESHESAPAPEPVEGRGAQKSLAERSETDLLAADAWSDVTSGAVPAEPDSVVVGETDPQLGAAATIDEDGAELLMADEAEALQVAEEAVIPPATVSGGQEEAATTAAGTTDAIEDGSGAAMLETMLVVGGVALALLGAILLLLTWLSRRVTDPLLR